MRLYSPKNQHGSGVPILGDVRSKSAPSYFLIAAPLNVIFVKLELRRTDAKGTSCSSSAVVEGPPAKAKDSSPVPPERPSHLIEGEPRYIQKHNKAPRRCDLPEAPSARLVVKIISDVPSC